MKRNHIIKRMLACLMVVIMTLTAIPLSGFVGLGLPQWSEMFATKASAKEDGVLKYEISNGKLTISGYTSLIKGDFVIPNTIGGYPVASIGTEAFEGCIELTSITIPKSVTSIGDSAFAGCSSLRSITIPEGVTSIGSFAFHNCESLTSVTIPDKVTYIGNHAFNHCVELKKVEIGNGLINLSYYVFNQCTGLEDIEIGTGLTEIVISAFAECNSLERIEIDSNNASFSSVNGVLYNKNKTEILKYPAGKEDHEYEILNTVKRIGNNAFYGCKSLTDITIPDHVTSIDNCAFCDCTNLTNIIIPDSVISIGNSAFGGCTELINITLPDSVMNVGSSAFDNTAWYNNQPSGSVYLGKVYYKYKGKRFEKSSASVKNGTKVIADSAFYGCSGLTSIYIPNSVLSIGGNAFCNCTGLTSVSLPSKLTNIGKSAFSSCTNLKSIIIMDRVANIGMFAFENCEKLSDVYYTGTKAQWNKINIGGDNYLLTEATIHYNYVSCPHNNITAYSLQPATCTKDGFSDGLFCEDCKTWISGHELIKMHHVDENIDKICDICGETIKIIIKSGIFGESIYNEYGDLIGYKDNVTYILYDDYSLVISGTGKMGDYYGDYIDLNYSGFRYDEKGNSIENKIKSIAIGSGVTYIGNNAFYNFINLTNVSIPDSVTEIEANAFGNCNELESVIIPNNVKTIGSYAFGNCGSLTSITIPESISKLADHIFDNCNKLVEINVASKNAAYSSENGVLFNKDKTKLIKYPQGKDDKEYVINNSVISIGGSAFEGCIHLRSISIPDSVTIIGNSAFSKCINLSNVSIGSNVSSIEYYAFYFCINLTSIVIPNKVTNIGEAAFLYCANLNSITVSDSVESVGMGAFNGTKWYNEQPDGDIYIGKVYYKYEGNMPENTSITIKEGTKGIAGSAFENCRNLIKIAFPQSIKSIGERSFYQCTGLTNISIPDNTTKIGHSAFYDCTCLTSVVIGNSVSDIGDFAFCGCKGLKSISIGKKVNRIGSSAFEYCSSLKSVTIPDSVTSLENCAFKECRNLENIKIGKRVTSISDSAFHRCFNLTSIIIPDSVKYIDSWAFGECTSLTSVTIGNGVEIISDNAFYLCPLKTVKIGKSIKEIGRSAFDVNKFNPIEIYYAGSKTGWKNISIDSTNSMLLSSANTMYYNVDPMHTHSFSVVVTTATTAKDGKIVTSCKGCGKISKTVVIPKIASISLSAKSYTYDGKVKTPIVTVKNSKGTTLKNGTDYTVTYASGRKTPGQYAVKITFKGNYSGSKTLYFTILPGVTSKIATATNSSAIKLAWKAVPGATGYRVFQYDTKTKKYVTLKTTTGTSYTVTKLKSGTSYKFAVRAYTIVNGKVFWASGYKTVTATTNPGTPTLKVTAGTKKAALSWNKQTGATGYVVYMATSQNGKYSRIATLKGNSKVSYTKTGLTKGKTYYFKVAAYTVANGKTLYSSFSSVKAVKIK